MEKIYSSYAQVLTEVDEILSHVEPELLEKVPNNLLEQIHTKKDSNYEFTYDREKSLVNQDVFDETKHLVSAIYLNYMCSEENKKELFSIVLENDKKYEEDLRKRYSADNIFSKKDDSSKEVKEEVVVETEETSLEVKKESFIKKLINKIISFFK